jgi:hypothetical protein
MPATKPRGWRMKFCPTRLSRIFGSRLKDNFLECGRSAVAALDESLATPEMNYPKRRRRFATAGALQMMDINA